MSNMSLDISRRSLLAGAAAGAVLAGISPRKAWADDPWGQAANIAVTLASPVSIPARQYNVVAYGAKKCYTTTTTAYTTSTSTSTVTTAATASGSSTVLTGAGGTYDNFAAFNNAIAAANAAGGGRVVVPPGNWYIAGPIILLSNVEFHLAAGATIYFDPTPSSYSRSGITTYCSAAISVTHSPTIYYHAGTSTSSVTEILVPSRWQGNNCYNYCPPIYAYGQSNIALTGEGTTSIFNGQAGVTYTADFPWTSSSGAASGAKSGCWWTMKGSASTAGWVSGLMGEGSVNPNNSALSTAYSSTALVNLAEYGSTSGGSSTNFEKDSSYLPAQSETYIPASSRIYGTGHYLPPPMIQLHSCSSVLLKNYQVTNTPFWQHNPVNCTNVTIYGVYANSNGPNNDGFDPDACRNVLIDTVTFNTGDDCIAIKAGKDNDTDFGACQNIVIQNCTMANGHGGVTLGSEMSGGVMNVYAQNLTFSSSTLQIAFRIKTNMNRGGYVKNFYVRNVTIPNGIQSTASTYAPLSASTSGAIAAIPASGGGIVTFDCDYSASSDNVRIRPPLVTNVNISNVTVSNGTSGYSCYLPIVIQGPVPSDYDGSGVLSTTPTVYPVSNVTISNCSFGTSACTTTTTVAATSSTYLGYIITPNYYLYNVTGLTLSNVTMNGTAYTTTLASPGTSS